VPQDLALRLRADAFERQEGVDAVGACVGLRGIRIQNVVNELLGEKIDVIEWDEDPVKFISNSLSPAVVDRVDLNIEEESATVLVPDRQLSLAIGREGQNARLAAKLTNWRIDIQGTSEVAVEAAAAATPQVTAATEEPAETVDAVAAAVASPAEDTAEVEAPAKTAAEVEVAAVPSSDTATEDSEAEAATETAPAEPEVEEEPSTSGIDAELLALEKELAELEQEEQARKEVEAAQMLDVSSDDLWQVASEPGTKASGDSAGGIRFAEDIAGFRETDAGRRGGRRGGSSARNRRRR